MKKENLIATPKISGGAEFVLPLLLRYPLALLLLLLFITGCKKDDEPQPDTNPMAATNRSIYDLMKEWYYWYGNLPDIDPAKYESPEALVEALRYRPLDRWSYATTVEEYERYYQAGEYFGYGYSSAWDSERNLYVLFVYRNSAAGRAGWQRGDKILRINGKRVQEITDISAELGANQAGVVTNFTLERGGVEMEYRLEKGTVRINSVLHRDVFSFQGRKIAHLVFKAFIEPSEQELNEAFDYFAAQGANELILDLRYNGGGRLSIAQQLVQLIAPPNANGQVFMTIEHNDKKQDQNSVYRFESTPNSLNLNKIAIITTGGTASASETIINGLRPYMEVKVIGTKTYGKPVGSYGWRIGETHVVLPIAFRVVNAVGVADYFEGIEVDIPAPDDYTRDFSDLEEGSLQTALNYIVGNPVGSGRFAIAPLRYSTEWKGLAQEIGAY
jgi:C-terminal processing protease CtpA/Prc